MMTASQFRKRSALFMRRRKNPIIQDIDTLLKEYEKTTSDNRKMKCLVYIYMMCLQYVHTKPNGRRIDAVRTLRDEVKQELDSPEFKKKLRAKAAGLHYSGGRASDAMSTTGATATSLAKGYTFEGILPQKNFVQKMHLNMNSILGTDQKYFGASMVSQEVESDLQMKGVSMDQSASQANEMLATMPMSKVLDWLHGMWTNPATSGDFNYLNSTQRLDYLLITQNGKFYRHNAVAPFDSGGRMVAYAMDNYERLYCLADARGVGVNWNHSSLLSGHPVICAGEMIVSQGDLRVIDNNSGHYKPGTDNLADCIRAIVQMGIDAQTFRVEDKSKKTSFATAAAFLATQG